MANKAYIELLKDPRWQKKRLEILNRDEWCCISCYNAELTLHVHHLKYDSGKMPWEYDNRFLVTLCENCHKSQSGINLRETFANAGILERDAENLAAAIKFLVPHYVNSEILTPQAVWSIIMDLIRANDLNGDDYIKFLFKFRKENAN
jgi:hypothetical protein